MTRERIVLNECQRLTDEGLCQEAVELLSQAISAAPSHELYYKRAELYEHLGEFNKALDDLSSSLQLNPNEAKYFESRGVLLSNRLERTEEALDDFCEASSINPSSPVPHEYLSLCHLQLGDLDAACDHARRAIALDDSDGFAHYCLGQCRLAEKRFHSAAKEFEIALKLQPQTARFWIGLSTACEEIGDLDKAELCCQNAIDLEASARSYIRLASIQLERANAQKAIESLEAAKTFALGEAEQLLVDGYLVLAKQRHQGV